MAAIEAAGIAGTPDNCVTAVRKVVQAGGGLVLFTAVDDLLGQADKIWLIGAIPVCRRI